ncbi:RagB/SusD family nutrient uptake outer membrane protein [Chitinophaga silvatica]|nr:RagB/SusD family nutrient uptake outer membrane protein [Chitinophaga silvatica]
MNKVFKNICLAVGLITTVSSCGKYLDVKPETSVLEEEAFKSAAGFQTALNGVYLQLSSYDMYGGKMHMAFPELLGQRYYQTSSSSYYSIASLNYAEKKTKDMAADYWNNNYKLIANLNNILDHLPGRKNLFAENDYNTIFGEVLALRTFLHFDLLRVFGPVFNTSDSVKSYIPYYSWRSAEARPYLPANQITDSLQGDITAALKYLKSDNIIKGAASPTDLGFPLRKTRFNYYAAKALQARMLLYRNDKAGAFEAAKEVINIQPTLFPFSGKNAADVQNDPSLLGDCLTYLENTKLPVSYDNLFVYTLDASALLAPRQEVLAVIYPETGDARMQTAVWRPASDGSKSVCFYKYAPIYRQSGSVKYQVNIGVPLIRASECYLIAAEADPDPLDAVKYLDVVRVARNILPTLANATLRTELTKEYRREFFGEGQMFFYYKRINSATMPNSSSTSTTATISMNSTKYIVPIPDDEQLAH